MEDFTFDPRDSSGSFLKLGTHFGQGVFPLPDLRAQIIKMMPRQLRVQVLQFLGKLFEAAGFAGLPLQRADLAFHLAHKVGHPQKVLIGILQLAQCLLFLRLVLGDSGGFLKNHPPILRLARQDLCNVALGHDAVAGPAHAGAHEQLLDVLKPAGGLVDEIFAATVPEHPPGDRHLVISYLHTSGTRCSSSTPPIVSDTSAIPRGLRRRCR
jgi:hypothetical protein